MAIICYYLLWLTSLSVHTGLKADAIGVAYLDSVTQSDYELELLPLNKPFNQSKPH